jgi:hypothetical protein
MTANSKITLFAAASRVGGFGFRRSMHPALKLGNGPTALIDDVLNVCLCRHDLASLKKVPATDGRKD